MPSEPHDTIVFRLAQILVKLNQGLKLDPKALAEEFNVNLRTIQRDLNERFAYLPLEKTDGRYALHPSFLGKLSTKDMQRFAALAGVHGLFPSLSDDFLREIFDDRMKDAVLVKGHHYEEIDGQEVKFRLIESAIVQQKHLGFDYDKTSETKHYDDVAPYRLVNNKGIWYLHAVHAEKLKTFAFTRIKAVAAKDTSFAIDSQVQQSIDQDDGVWVAEKTVEVVLKVSKEVAGYFKRRKLVANQVIEKELADGGLLISAKVGHMNQVLPIVRYWIPHVAIISPESWQKQLEQELVSYLKNS